MKVRNNLINNLILKSFPALLLTFGLCLPTLLLPVTGFASTPGSMEIAAEDKDFNESFREGRDLIDREQWAQAAKKFNEIVVKFPDHKSAAAALYWLAFCYKKQKLFKETEATLDRLLERFPASSWAGDARVMKMEIAAPLGKWDRATVIPDNSAVLPAGVYATTLPNNNTNGSVTTIVTAASPEALKTYNKMNAATAETPLDREDEIKIAAFQSLLSADAKRGIEAMSGILKPDSKASETLKIEVLRALRRPRLTANLMTQPTALISNAGSFNKELIPLLRETLVDSFKDEKNTKIRKEIIYTLANLRDDQTLEYLAGVYQSETDREVKKAIINGFGSFAGISGFSFARVSENSSTQKPNVIVSKANAQAKGLEFVKLLEIVKTEKDTELKTLAFTNLQRFEGWSADAKIVETLVQTYDSETDENFKKTVIQSFGKINQAAVLRKLFDIAKNDKSDKLRLEAIYALRNSKDPEALKFLEDLIK